MANKKPSCCMQCAQSENLERHELQYTKLTKEKGKALGLHRNTVINLVKRGALLIGGEVYAPLNLRRKK